MKRTLPFRSAFSAPLHSELWNSLISIILKWVSSNSEFHHLTKQSSHGLSHTLDRAEHMGKKKKKKGADPRRLLFTGTRPTTTPSASSASGGSGPSTGLGGAKSAKKGNAAASRSSTGTATTASAGGQPGCKLAVVNLDPAEEERILETLRGIADGTSGGVGGVGGDSASSSALGAAATAAAAAAASSASLVALTHRKLAMRYVTVGAPPGVLCVCVCVFCAREYDN